MGRLALVTIGAIILLGQVNAQSGRRKTPGPTPTPTPVSGSPSTSPSSTAASTTSPVDSGEKATQPKFHPKAFIITGKTKTEGFKSYGGDDVGEVADEIKFMFEFQHFPARVIKGGKMTREQAIARAKQETDSYVLWMEIVQSMEVVNLRANPTVEHIDYILLMPGTGEVVRKFTVDPGKIVQKNGQGTPLPPRTQGRSRDSGVQLRQCAWEMSRVLRYWL